VQAFTSGTVVQVFLLAGSAATEAWSESAPITHEKGVSTSLVESRNSQKFV